MTSGPLFTHHWDVMLSETGESNKRLTKRPLMKIWKKLDFFSLALCRHSWSTQGCERTFSGALLRRRVQKETSYPFSFKQSTRWLMSEPG